MEKHPLVSTGSGFLATLATGLPSQLSELEPALRVASLIVSVLCGLCTLLLAVRRLQPAPLHPAVRRWLGGLWTAFLMSGTNVIVNMGVTPEVFNLGDGFGKTVKLALISGAVGLILELRKKPLPDEDTAPVQTPGKTLAVLLLCGLMLTGCGGADREFRHRVESTEVGGKALISPDGSTGIGARVKVTFRDPGTGLWRVRSVRFRGAPQMR